MGLMGTLAKVAMGYAAARGVDHLSKNGGLGGLLGGAQVASDAAQAAQSPAAEALGQIPGMDQLQGMMGQMQEQGSAGMGNMQEMMGQLQEQGAAGMGNMQEMMGKMMGALGGGAGGAGGMDLQSMLGGLMGGGQSQEGGEAGGGLLSGAGGAGLAGLLAMAGGAAAASGQGVGGLLDQFNTADTAPEAEEAAGLMLRAMIQAAKADGDIDAAEKAKILETIGEDADADDIAFVQDQLAAPIDIAGLAADTPDAQKMQVYSMSLMSIRVDTQAEAAYLDQLAGALGLDQQTVNMLHMQMGVQPLYS